MFSSIIFLYLLSLCHGRPEPQCSSFHYEEKLLEKMIRTEIKVEEMAADMHTSQQAVTDAVASLDGLRGVEGKLHTFQDETKNRIDDFNKAMEQKLASLEAELKSPKEGASNTPVAFLVKRVPDKSLTKSEVIIFKDVEFDLGNGYDVSTGKFTAPQAGIYVLSVILCVNNGNLTFAIIQGGTKTIVGDFTDPETVYAPCGSSVVTVKLNANEQVWVEATSSSSTLYSDTYRQNYFSGSLVQIL